MRYNNNETMHQWMNDGAKIDKKKGTFNFLIYNIPLKITKKYIQQIRQEESCFIRHYLECLTAAL
jgi:hypothetical protein